MRSIGQDKNIKRECVGIQSEILKQLRGIAKKLIKTLI